MSKKHLLLLTILAAIWGSSFMFMKVLSLTLGPLLTTSLRLLIGFLFLFVFYKIYNIKVDIKKDYKHYIVVGVLSQAIPYTLFSYAALYIDSSISVIMNSTAPMFGIILSYLLLSERISLRQSLGLILGTTGVSIISILNTSSEQQNMFLGVTLCLIASFFYGLNGIYIKSKASSSSSKSIALGSQAVSGILLLPLAILNPIEITITKNVVITMILFGSLGSGVANMIYFKLMTEVGPVKTLSVTYLMPVFGIAWGALLLQEKITPNIVVGGFIIIIGLYFVLKKER